MTEKPSSRGFGSDNHAGVLPEMLSAITKVNQHHAAAYGVDGVSEACYRRFKEVFGQDTQTLFVFNGTAANILCLKTLSTSYQSTICTDVAHLNVDECAAPEAVGGRKLIPLPHTEGKLVWSDIEKQLIRFGDQHFAQVKVISLTQPTELGTLYSFAELENIVKRAKDAGLRIHIDGTRLVVAATALGCSLKALSSDLGVDAVSFGGTKNGLLFGEAVLFFDKSLAHEAKFYRKQLLNLPSKTRFLAAQFDTFLRPECWKYHAAHQVEMAKRLNAGLAQVPQIEITQKSEANAVFCTIPKSWLKPLREVGFFYVWDEHLNEVRLMMSFDTQNQEVDAFIKRAQALSGSENAQPGRQTS